MKKIYSRVESSKLLHLVFNASKNQGRAQIVDSDEFLQVASLELKKGENFSAHKHLWKDLPTNRNIAQESWVILKGRVEVTFFDLDNSQLEKLVLNAGDISITLYGGHGYKVLEDTIAIEFKSGPYLGQILDKVYI
jgi:mannose-6-phosphate isomerase-like protein (cupin superfamily)